MLIFPGFSEAQSWSMGLPPWPRSSRGGHLRCGYRYATYQRFVSSPDDYRLITSLRPQRFDGERWVPMSGAMAAR